MADPAVGWPTSVDPSARGLEVAVALREAAWLRPLRAASAYLVLP
jgi:hypothetical protein